MGRAAVRVHELAALEHGDKEQHLDARDEKQDEQRDWLAWVRHRSVGSRVREARDDVDRHDDRRGALITGFMVRQGRPSAGRP